MDKLQDDIDRLAREIQAEAEEEEARTARLANGGGNFRNANAERRRAEGARLADKYITKDGAAPQLDELGGMSPAEYGVVRADLA